MGYSCYRVAPEEPRNYHKGTLTERAEAKFIMRERYSAMRAAGTSILGGHVIRAGCRTMTVEDYRRHAKTYTSSEKTAETLRILALLETSLAAISKA